MIPSPYPLDGPQSPQQKITHIEMKKMSMWLNEMRNEFKLGSVIFIARSKKKHDECGIESCDHYEKVIINLDFTKGDVEDIIGGLESLFGSI